MGTTAHNTPRSCNVLYTQAAELKPGRWYETPKGSKAEWVAVCAKCGALKAAGDLELKRLPFGRGEQWQCAQSGC